MNNQTNYFLINTPEILLSRNPLAHLDLLDSLPTTVPLLAKSYGYDSGGTEDEEDEEGSELHQYVHNKLLAFVGRSTALLHIEGYLTPDFVWYEPYMDITSYEAINYAVAELLEMTNIKNVILLFKSHGGNASGCGECSDNLTLLSKYKETTISHSVTDMSSAAYWLAASAKAMTSTKYALSGSIGGFSVYISRAKLYKEAGIGVQVTRTAKKKGLLNGVEPISNEAREVLKKSLEDAVAPFVAKVEERPNLSGEWDSGLAFVGAEAKTYGLVDNVVSTNKLIEAVAGLE